MLLLTIKNKLYKWCCALILLAQAAVVHSANVGTAPIVTGAGAIARAVADAIRQE